MVWLNWDKQANLFLRRCGLSGTNQKIHKKSLDDGVDYPGQTTKIEKKVLDSGVDYPEKTYQSVLL